MYPQISFARYSTVWAVLFRIPGNWKTGWFRLVMLNSVAPITDPGVYITEGARFSVRTAPLMVPPEVFATSNANGPSSPQITSETGLATGETITCDCMGVKPNSKQITRTILIVFFMVNALLKIQQTKGYILIIRQNYNFINFSVRFTMGGHSQSDHI